MDWGNEQIVVTGGAGMIGRALLDNLASKDAGIMRIIDNLCNGNVDNIPQKYRDKLWTTDLETTWPSLFGASIVIHLAAKVTGMHYNRKNHYKMMMTNLDINTNVARAVALARPRLFLYVSTACVYPHDAPVPTPEQYGGACNPEPTNWGYGVAKWVGEQQAIYLNRELGIPTIIVRFFNAIGVGDHYEDDTSHVTPALIKRVVSGERPLMIWGTGNQTRVLVDSRDIAEALVRLIDCPEAHDASPVNIGHTNEVSMKELGRTILNLYGANDWGICFDPTVPEGYPRRAPDTTRLQSLIGWVPNTPLAVSITDMIKDYAARYSVTITVPGPKRELSVGTHVYGSEHGDKW